MDSQIPPEEKWPALRKSNILSNILNKHVQFIALADRRAQGTLTIFAFLIPLSIAGMGNPAIKVAMSIFLLFALASACCALLSLLPKRYNAVKECDCQMLHFSGISRFKESEYMERMKVMLNDKERLAAAVTLDIYHISHDILRPKFLWMRISYFLLFTGSAIAIITIILNYL
jgi:hypothetical protein